jgi:hypothetical protein
LFFFFFCVSSRHFPLFSFFFFFQTHPSTTTMSAGRTLALGLNDAVPISLTFKYTFEAGEIDVDRLGASLRALIDSEAFWPLRGTLRGMQIQVPERLEMSPAQGGPDCFQVAERPDLSLAMIRSNAGLAQELTFAFLTEGDPVLAVRVTKLADGVLMGVNISHAYADAHTYFRIFLPAWAAAYGGDDSRGTIPDVINDRSVFGKPAEPCETAAAAAAESSLPSSGHGDDAASKSHGGNNVAPPAPPAPAPVPAPAFMLLPMEAFLAAATAAAAPTPLSDAPAVPDFARSTLRVPAATVKRLMAVSRTETRAEALFATIWKALDVGQISFPCNIRGSATRWRPVVPNEYAGNGIVLHRSHCFPRSAGALPLAELASLFRAAVHGCTAETNTAVLAELAGSVSARGGQLLTVAMSPFHAAITSWLRCETRPAFGAARPRCLWASMDHMRGLVCLTEAEPDGVDIHAHTEELAAIAAVIANVEEAGDVVEEARG